MSKKDVKKDVKIPNSVLKLLKDKNQGIKLDLACGASKQGDDWVGIDIQKFKGVDIVHDIETYPFPLPDNCCSIILASHILEHINPAKFGFINIMNELWRIMKPGGELFIIVPYAGSPGYWQDPTHVNPCNEMTWQYFDPLAKSGYFRFYHPKPWKIDNKRFFANQVGHLELVLIKRLEDKSYYVTKAEETK